MRYPLITAHAGSEIFPANTVESVLGAAKAGADFCEVDVRCTADGVPILYHDNTMSTVSQGIVEPGKLTYKELKELEAGEEILPLPGRRLTCLEDVLDAVLKEDIRLNLDMKDNLSVTKAAEMAAQKDMTGRIVFSGCHRDRAALAPGLPLNVLLNVDEEYLESVTDEAQYIRKAEHLCTLARELGCCGMNLRYDLRRPQLVSMALRHFLPVAVWTVKSGNFAPYVEMGVWSITTDNVRDLAQFRLAAPDSAQKN